MASTASSRRLVSQFQADRARERSGRQVVAAVCYRVGNHGVEFLLVRTRGGHWIFPKGGVVPGLSYAQSAAVEAFEEAGVHGRIEEIPFARYHQGKSENLPRKGRPSDRKPVIAHLCEVSHLERPQEQNRKPTWFPAEKAKRRLVEDRSAEFGEELAGIVDRAVARIRRLGGDIADPKKDALQRNRIEAFENGRPPSGKSEAQLVQYFMLRRRAIVAFPRGQAEFGGHQSSSRRILQLAAGPNAKAASSSNGVSRAK